MFFSGLQFHCRIEVIHRFNNKSYPDISAPLYCGLYEFRCENGRCIDNLKRCDGSDDCDDGSDEARCAGEDILNILPATLVIKCHQSR